MKVTHTIAPVYDKSSKVLILGTMPSPKSREAGFYYGHPQNRFWSVLAEVLQADMPVTTEQKKRLVLNHGIALWDVLHSCDIKGADDSSIKNPVLNDFSIIFDESDIMAVFTTGKTAWKLFTAHCGANINTFYLPSTSPANRKITFNELVAAYEAILPYCRII